MAATILGVTSFWIILVVSRILPSFAKPAFEELPFRALLTFVFGMPLFLAVASVKIRVAVLTRLISIVLLIVGASLLSVIVETRPILTVALIAFMYLETFLIIPAINKKIRY